MDDARLERIRRRSLAVRERSLALATEARRRLTAPPLSRRSVTGRLWVNGREVGGADARFAHLGRSHD